MLTNGKLAKRFPFWRERGTIWFTRWWKVESTMWIRRNDGSMLFLDFYQKPYAVSTPLFSPQGAHRPGLLMLSHRLEFRRNLPTCKSLTCTDHVPAYVLIIRYSYNCCTMQPYVLLSYSPLMRRPLPESGSTVFRKTSQKSTWHYKAMHANIMESLRAIGSLKTEQYSEQ